MNLQFVFETLSRFGINKNLNSILAFEDKEYFRCFDLENAHLLVQTFMFWVHYDKLVIEQNNPSVRKVFTFLEKTKTLRAYWEDKWHLSPYYTTSHAIISCAGFENDLVQNAVNWINQHTKENGAWGIFKPTAEETAYALQALWIWKQDAGIFIPMNVRKERAWLEEHQG